MAVRFVTFGFDHHHEINNIHFNHNCVAVIEGTRDDVFNIFEKKFCMEYTKEYWDHSKMNDYYPDGYKLLTSEDITNEDLRQLRETVGLL